MKSQFLKIFFFLFILLNLILSSWYLLHGDLDFTWEVARDFFLLDEMRNKGAILIGPSSSTGLFHGPLWTYVNYPLYLFGNSNPIVVGWGWVIMIIGFLVSGFYIAKNLFDTKTAYFYTLINSVYVVFHAKSLYNPHGAMFIIPAFFFFFIKYIQTHDMKYLIAHVLLGGALIHFQMAIGVPFVLLSFFYAAVDTLKAKKKRYLFIYLLIFVTMSNFIVFDLRHDFLLSKLTINFLTSTGRDNLNIISMVYQRINFMTSGIEFFRPEPGYGNLAVFLIFCVFMFFQIKDKKYKKIYYLFIYFYFGYLLVSNLNSGGLLYFYLFPLFSLVFLIFASFVTSRLSKIFILIILLILLYNQRSALIDIVNAEKKFIGKDQNSWLFLSKSAEKMFFGNEAEFGYFVYHPGTTAYQPKYAMHYIRKFKDKKTYYFQKKQTAYLFIAPPPADNPYMKDEWWRVNLLHINKDPSLIIRFDNGYKIEKYKLTDEEINVPTEQSIDPGIHFR